MKISRPQAQESMSEWVSVLTFESERLIKQQQQQQQAQQKADQTRDQARVRSI